jgi:hypothetical protein
LDQNNHGDDLFCKLQAVSAIYLNYESTYWTSFYEKDFQCVKNSTSGNYTNFVIGVTDFNGDLAHQPLEYFQYIRNAGFNA